MDKYILLLHKKLSGQITEPENLSLIRWREKHPDQDKVLSDMEAIWQSTQSYQPSPEISTTNAKESFFKAIQQEEKEPEVFNLKLNRSSRFRFIRMTSIAAAILILVGAYFIYQYITSPSVPSFMEQKELIVMDSGNKDLPQILADGSRLWLREGSFFRLDKDFNASNRTCYLEGELFVHVADNADLPFIIKMKENQIRVVGTAFYIKSDNTDLVELKVEEGKVQFSGPDQQSQLVSAGQQASFNRSTGLIKSENLNQDPLVSNWRSEYLVFDNVPLYTVFEKLSIFYGVEFDIDCKNIEEFKGFTSLIQYDQTPKLNTFIQAIHKVYDIEIEKSGKESFRVYGDACK